MYSTRDAKTVKIVKMVNFVAKEDVFLPFAKKTVIVVRATNAILKNVLLDVYMINTVRRAKNVLMTIVPFHQVIVCVIYFPFWHSLTEINKLC